MTILSFFILFTHTIILHPSTKIPALNDKPTLFSNCICDVIQVEQKYYACFFLIHKDTSLKLCKASTRVQWETRWINKVLYWDAKWDWIWYWLFEWIMHKYPTKLSVFTETAILENILFLRYLGLIFYKVL